jgi:predicted nucleic acid-binding protein
LKVIVDTSIWSLAFRRGKQPDKSIIVELESLISDYRVQLIGPIRQELLSGIKSAEQFDELKQYLSFIKFKLKILFLPRNFLINVGKKAFRDLILIF